MGFAVLPALLIALASFGQPGELSRLMGPATLAKAVRAGDAAVVREHGRAGFGGDTISSAQTSTTALMVASVLGDPKVIAILASSATNIDAREKFMGMGETALMKSLIRGSEAGTLVLLSNGADPRITNAWGWNALHLAAYRGFESVALRLATGEGAAKQATADGFTALHVAARFGRTGLAVRLLAAGADRNARTSSGLTPLDLAASGSFHELAAILGGQKPGKDTGTLPPRSPAKKTAGVCSATTSREGGRVRIILERQEEVGKAPSMRLEVEPASGGRVVAWRVGTRDLLKPLDSMDGDRAGGIPILFPTPNEVKECRLSLGDETILMRNPDQPRPSGMHGYAIDDLYAWEAPRVASDEVSLTMRLEHDARSVRWRAFPRSNTLFVTYRLGPAGLRIEYEVTNRDRRALPAGFGVHPYWAMEAETALRLTANHGRLARFEGGVRTLTPVGEGTDLRAGRLVSDFPPGTSFYFDPGASARLAWLDAPPLALHLSADSGLGYLVVHKPGKGAFCVEHQGNAPDAHRMLAGSRGKDAGLFVIAPGGHVKGWVDYRLSTAP
jgi:galactose mutarotase-like enzyme